MITMLSGSSRKNGNTEFVLDQLTKATGYKRYFLNSLCIERVIDSRHDNSEVIHNDDYKMVLDSVIDSDIVIMATPLYWYSMSASLKLFIDRWTETLRDSDYPDFKEIMRKKEFIIIIIGGDNPEKKAIPLQDQFKLIFEFMEIDNYKFIIGKGNKPLEIINDIQFMHSIKKLNERVLNDYEETE